MTGGLILNQNLRYTGDDDPDEDNASPTIAIMQVIAKDRCVAMCDFLFVVRSCFQRREGSLLSVSSTSQRYILYSLNKKSFLLD